MNYSRVFRESSFFMSTKVQGLFHLTVLQLTIKHPYLDGGFAIIEELPGIVISANFRLLRSQITRKVTIPFSDFCCVFTILGIHPPIDVEVWNYLESLTLFHFLYHSWTTGSPAVRTSLCHATFDWNQFISIVLLANVINTAFFLSFFFFFFET